SLAADRIFLRPQPSSLPSTTIYWHSRSNGFPLAPNEAVFALFYCWFCGPRHVRRRVRALSGQATRVGGRPEERPRVRHSWARQGKGGSDDRRVRRFPMSALRDHGGGVEESGRRIRRTVARDFSPFSARDPCSCPRGRALRGSRQHAEPLLGNARHPL